MSNVNERIERLIGRHLDGVSSPDEELELSRELIRNPEAHQMLEEYRRIDSLAGAALDEVLGQQRCVVDPTKLTDRLTSSKAREAGRHPRVWWLVPGAIAAALLMLFLVRDPATTLLDRRMMQPDGMIVANHRDVGMEPVRRASSVSAPERASPLRRVRRDTFRDLLGVVGDDGNTYWFQVDRIRTTREPNKESPVRLARGDL